MGTFEVLSGPGERLPWSMPTSRGHDDLLISAALAARLDASDLSPAVTGLAPRRSLGGNPGRDEARLGRWHAAGNS